MISPMPVPGSPLPPVRVPKSPAIAFPLPSQRRRRIPAMHHAASLAGILLAASLLPRLPHATAAAPAAWPGDPWRAEHRIVDMHQHIQPDEAHIQRAVRILDRAGVGLGVNLSGGVVTSKPGGHSAFQQARSEFERVAPGRFLQYFNLDYTGFDEPGFAERAVQQVERAHELGAAGFKEYKRLGLFLRDSQAALIRIDDPRLDGVWRRCGELGMPVSIHVADPRAFWQPYDPSNERWRELKDHRNWWFGDPSRFPAREELLAALDRVIARHPGTTFVCVHFANNAEDLDWVDRKLDERPNMFADLAARIPEIGRQDPDRVRKLFIKHQDRIVFATDFQVYQKLILGSSGDADQPTEDDAVAFYRKEWRWLETDDRDWPHMTPIQGDWNIHSIGLPAEVLRKIYFDNARRILVRSLPFETLHARRISRDFAPRGRISRREWQSAKPLHLERHTENGQAVSSLSTTCRALWSDRFLYLAYECPFTQLTTFHPPQAPERLGPQGQNLWDRDVVEAFIGSSPEDLKRYAEFQWAPTGESMDLKLVLPERDFAWSSGMESRVHVDRRRRVWTVEVRIPWNALSDRPPSTGDRWRCNLYRIDRAHRAFLAMNPTLRGSYHTPERFGWLTFEP